MIEIYPQIALPYNKRGIAYDKIKQHQKAIDDYSEAIRLKPDYVDALYNRALTYGKLEEYQLAIEDLNRVIKLKPDHAEAYHYRGVIYFIMGKELHGYIDAKKAAALGDLNLLEWTKDFGKPLKENVS